MFRDVKNFLKHEHAIHPSLRLLPAVHGQILPERSNNIYRDLRRVFVVHVGLHEKVAW